MITYEQISAGEENKFYIGDGVYASFDGEHLWLRTQRVTGWDEIALGPNELDALDGYIRRLRMQLAERRKAYEDSKSGFKK